MIDANLMHAIATLRNTRTKEQDTFVYSAERDEVNDDTGNLIFLDMSKSEVEYELQDRVREQCRILYGKDWVVVHVETDF
jgi:hypothetical protein